MIVLSVFDGHSCGQIALREMGIKVDCYYASEIDKFAIQQTQHNFPDTIQLGDIVEIRRAMCWKISVFRKFLNSPLIPQSRKSKFSRIRNILNQGIDLYIGGSPCQGFSFSGKGLNFNDPRSRLFFEYVAIWRKIHRCNPRAKFLLENVRMKKEHLRVISEKMGIFGARINSNLVSAQNRDRWYWTNIRTRREGFFRELHSDIPQPRDRGVLLKDILQPEEEVDEKHYLKSKEVIRGIEQAKPKEWRSGNKMGAMKFPNNIACKAKTLTVVQAKGGRETNHIQVPILKTNGEYSKPVNGKSNCIDANYHKGLDNHQQRTGVLAGGKIRKLTPIECARLQTIPDWYEWVVSDTQVYRQVGNGWTVEVIKHIFSYL